MRISGETTWRNPYGYLPGELYAYLPFFGTMTLAYLVLGGVWLFLCLRYRQVLLSLQVYLGGVRPLPAPRPAPPRPAPPAHNPPSPPARQLLALGLFEAFTWYLEYARFNTGGTRGAGLVTLGVLVSTVRKTASRVLLLAVCLGYGVVRPTLGSSTGRVRAINLGAIPARPAR